MEEDPIVCSECGAEPGEETATQAELELEGWDFEGEFGPRCLECVANQNTLSGTAGLGDLAEALGATKKE